MEDVVLAVGAHPDDVEFMMAGTLLLLGEAGCEMHIWSLANGCYGALAGGREEVAGIRSEESRAAAELAGARLHPPLVDDHSILYEPGLVRRVAAVIRVVKPSIILAPAPDDYMEDHTNASRVVVSAAFTRAIGPYETDPRTDPWQGDVVIYHAMPYGLRDPLRRAVRAGIYVDVTGVMDRKRMMLKQHRSQVEWLDASQGVGSYLDEMVETCRAVGRISGEFEYAEGWRRRSHLGYSRCEADPLEERLGARCMVNQAYEDSLDPAGR